MDVTKLLLGLLCLGAVFAYLIYKSRVSPEKNFEAHSEFVQTRQVRKSDRDKLHATIWLSGYLKSANYQVHKAAATAPSNVGAISCHLVGTFGGPDVAMIAKRSSGSRNAVPGIIDCNRGHKPRADISNVTKSYASALGRARLRVWQLSNQAMPSVKDIQSGAQIALRLDALVRPGGLICLELGPEYVVALFTFESLKAEPRWIRDAAVELEAMCMNGWTGVEERSG